MSLKRGKGLLSGLLEQWPAYQDFQDLRRGKPLGEVGLGDNAISSHTRSLEPRTRTADKVVPSVCPFCAVGCSQLIYVRDGKIINIEGNPASPINGGTLCPKGAATFGLLVNPARITTVKYRAPYSDRWEDKPLDWAMERIAQLVRETRDRQYQTKEPETGKTLHRCPNIGSIGGATLDNEENYLIKKLFSAGLGMIWIENQARI
jgi:formate dehydrogenase major subunit